MQIRYQLAAVLFLLTTPTSFISADPLAGYWYNDGTLLLVSNNGNSLKAVIVGLTDNHYEEGESVIHPAGSVRRDENNPDSRLSGRPIVGINLLQDFRYVNEAWSGKLYDPGNGRLYSAKITIDPDGLLAMRGYIGFSLIGRTVKWRRAVDCPAEITKLARETKVIACQG